MSARTEQPEAALRFVKVEGAGNDYVLVDVCDQYVDDPAGLARRVSDRHRGIGSDGVLTVGPGGDDSEATMAIYNADGSLGQMCGNGLRCVVRYLAESRGLPATESDPVRVQTASGVLRGFMRADGHATIEMGVPRFDASIAPSDHGVTGHFVSTGNPHLVVRVENPREVDLADVGTALGAPSPELPIGANVHVVAVTGSSLVVRPWELGSGATQACGTGAVAAVAVARDQGWIDHVDPAADVVVAMPGGELLVRWTGSGVAWLTGPAELVYRGELTSW